LIATRRDEIARRQESGGDERPPDAGLRIDPAALAEIVRLLLRDPPGLDEDLLEAILGARRRGAHDIRAAQIEEDLDARALQAQPAGPVQPAQEQQDVGDAERLQSTADDALVGWHPASTRETCGGASGPPSRARVILRGGGGGVNDPGRRRARRPRVPRPRAASRPDRRT